MSTELKKIKIYDNNFSHSDYSTDYQKSKYIIWDRNLNENDNEPLFYTDNYLNRFVTKKENSYAWILEPKSVSPNVYDTIKKVHKNFIKVLTYDKELLDIGENFIFYPLGGCWVSPNDQNIHSKTKLVSIIVSSKNYTDGHKLRHSVINEFKDKVDVYGRGYNPILHKIEGLKNYKFSIAIENSRKDYYFSEKLIDCFMTGTIPIYYGCPSISNFFDINGIITFESLEDLKKILPNLNENFYTERIESIKLNFEIAKKYLISEDWIKENLKIL